MARTLIGAPWHVDTASEDIVFLPRNIAAGSLVIVPVRYEAGLAAMVAVSDSAGQTYQIIEQYAGDKNATWPNGREPVVTLAYKWNHPGGTNVVITCDMSAGRAYVEGPATEWTGGDATDPLEAQTPPTNYTGNVVGFEGSNPSLNYAATGAGMAVALTGAYSAGGGITPDSPGAVIDGTHPYSTLWGRAHTGAGTFTISGTGGSGLTNTVVAVFRDPGGGGGGGPSITSVTPSTFSPGDTVTIVCTGAGATQGASTLDVDGEAQPVLSWSDTSVQFRATRGALAYGSHTLTLTNGTSDTETVTLSPPVGWAAYTIGTPAGSGLLPFLPPLAAGDQQVVQTVGGLVAGATDGTYSVSGTGYVAFGYEGWSSGSGWGTLNTFVVFAQSTTNTGRGTKGGAFGFTGWFTAARRRGVSPWTLLYRRPERGATLAAGWQVFSDWVFQNPNAAAALQASAYGTAAASASLSTGIRLAAAATGTAFASASLTTGSTSIAAAAWGVSYASASLVSGIRLASVAAGTATASAALTAGIALAAAGVGTSQATANLSTGAGGLSAAAAGTSAATAILSAGIKLAAVAAGTASANASLSAGIALAASGSGSCSASASLTTGVRLAADAVGSASATAALTTAPQGFQAAAVGNASASATLTTVVRLQAAAVGTASASAALTTQPQTFAAVAVGTARATASLTTGTALQAAASASASASASLTTAVRLLASAQATATASASLSTAAAEWAAAAVARAQAAAALTTAIALQAVAKGSATATADSSSAVLVPNPGRTYYVDAESRVLAVEAEKRVLQVSPGQGTIEMRNKWLLDRLATLDFTWDLAARGWLEVGDRIVDHDISGTGFALGAHSHTDTAITAFITPNTGQAIGTVIYPRAKWTTQQGRVDARVLQLTLTDRGWHER